MNVADTRKTWQISGTMSSLYGSKVIKTTVLRTICFISPCVHLRLSISHERVKERSLLVGILDARRDTTSPLVVDHPSLKNRASRGASSADLRSSKTLCRLINGARCPRIQRYADSSWQRSLISGRGGKSRGKFSRR